MSIYGLKQASRSWNIRFVQSIKSFGFEQNLDEPCVYKRHQSSNFPSTLCWWYSTHWKWCRGNVISKDLVVKPIWYEGLGKANYILGIKLWRDRKNRMLGLSQTGYIDKIPTRFSMKTPRKNYFLLDMKYLCLMTKGLRLLKRKRQWDKFLMLQQWEVSCMPCYVLSQISIIKLA